MNKIIDIISKTYKDFEVWQEQKIVKVIENSKEGNKQDFISSLNTAIRVFKDGKKGFVYLSGDSYEEDIILQNLKFSIENSFVDDANVLPIPDINDGEIFGTKKYLCESEILKKKITPIIDFQKEYEKTKKIERATISAEEVEINFFNSKKGFAKQNYQKYALGIVLVVQQDGDEKIEWDYCISEDLEDINEREVFKKAYYRGVKLLNSSPINSGKYPVLMESRSACEFLDILAKSFVAENLFKKKSLFDEKKVFPPLLTIIEDPLINSGSLKYFFDGEGFLTSKKELMSNGEIKNFVYDNFYGIKFGKKSNGGSIRTNIIAPPKNSYTNVYIAPSENKIENKIKESDEVVAIVSLIGMHLVNPVTGEFSVGFEGYLLKKGEFVKSLSQCTISGNIKDLFSSIIEIDGDLIFYGNTGSPSILFSEIAISGL